jgi:hypothetical protein
MHEQGRKDRSGTNQQSHIRGLRDFESRILGYKIKGSSRKTSQHQQSFVLPIVCPNLLVGYNQNTYISQNKPIEHDFYGAQSVLQQYFRRNKGSSPNDYDHGRNDMKKYFLILEHLLFPSILPQK